MTLALLRDVMYSVSWKRESTLRKQHIGDRDGIETHHHSRRDRSGFEGGKRTSKRGGNSRIDCQAKALRLQSQRPRGDRAFCPSETLADAWWDAECTRACGGQGSVRIAVVRDSDPLREFHGQASVSAVQFRTARKSRRPTNDAFPRTTSGQTSTSHRAEER